MLLPISTVLSNTKRILAGCLDIKFTNREALLSDSTCNLEAKPGKRYIERCEPVMLFISIRIGSLFKLRIMT